MMVSQKKKKRLFLIKNIAYDEFSIDAWCKKIVFSGVPKKMIASTCQVGVLVIFFGDIFVSQSSQVFVGSEHVV